MRLRCTTGYYVYYFKHNKKTFEFVALLVYFFTLLILWVLRCCNRFMLVSVLKAGLQMLSIYRVLHSLCRSVWTSEVVNTDVWKCVWPCVDGGITTNRLRRHMQVSSSGPSHLSKCLHAKYLHSHKDPSQPPTGTPRINLHLSCKGAVCMLFSCLTK